MVVQKTSFKCPYCKNIYDNESEARACARSCVDIEGPIETSAFYCEVCNSPYRHEERATACELRHEKNNDPLFQQFLVKKNFDELKKAAKLPGQKKLLEVE